MLSTSRPAAIRAFVLALSATAALSLSLAATARGDESPPVVAAAPLASAKSPTVVAAAPAGAPHGLAVVAVGDTVAIAWPLAQKIYAAASLRPNALDEPRARALAGEPSAATDSAEVRDFAEMRAAVKGDDAPSRAVLTSLAHAVNVRGLVVVSAAPALGGAPTARVFVADGAGFDSASYVPDGAAAATATPSTAASVAPLVWDGAVRSLVRSFGAAPAPATAAASGTASASTAAILTATSPVPASKTDERSVSHPFYTSPWFWTAVGAALVGAGAVYLGTRDNGAQAIHLQMQVPK